MCSTDPLIRIDLLDLLREFEPGARLVEAASPSDLDATAGDETAAIVILHGDAAVFRAATEVSAMERDGASILLVAAPSDEEIAAERGWILLPRPFTDAEFRASVDIAKSKGATGRRASEAGF